MDHLDIALSIKRDVFFLLSYREKFLSSRRVARDIFLPGVQQLPTMLVKFASLI